MNQISFGVSPAYYISTYGTHFTVEQVCESLELLAHLGFKSYQPEVYYEERLDEWIGGAQKVAKTASLLGLKASQLVAHFMMDFLLDPQNLAAGKGLEQTEKIIKIAGHFPECRQITIPLGGWKNREEYSVEELEGFRSLLFNKLAEIGLAIHQAGYMMALEILPNSLLNSMHGFEKLCHEMNEFPIFYNFDSGHAWASGENVAGIPVKFKDRIIGTHLCDNFGSENLSLRPGSGNIPWQEVMGNLMKIENLESLDIEIHCPSALVKEEYSAGKEFLANLLKEFHPQES